MVREQEITIRDSIEKSLDTTEKDLCNLKKSISTEKKNKKNQLIY